MQIYVHMDKKINIWLMGVHICEVCVGRQFCWESSQRFAIPEDVDAINEDDYWNLRAVGRVPSQEDIYPLKMISLRRPKVRIRRKQNAPKCPRTDSGTISSCRWRDHMLVRYYDCDNLGRSVLQLSHEFHEFVHTKEWFPAEVECLERWSQIHDSHKIQCESLKVPSLRPVIFMLS